MSAPRKRLSRAPFRAVPASPPGVELAVATLADFTTVEEDGAAALVGDENGALIPENGDVMLYGDGGAGKTTLAIDLSFHLAAGQEWLGMPIARPVRVLLVENEGPRPLFRKKLRGKRDAWTGPSVDDRIVVVEAPWARLSFAETTWREALASSIREHEIDVVVAGPVTSSGSSYERAP